MSRPPFVRPSRLRFHFGNFPVPERPSNAYLRWQIALNFGVWLLIGSTFLTPIVAIFRPEDKSIYLLTAILGAAVAVTIGFIVTLRNGRRRREEFIQCGGDPTGVTDLMFGFMLGERNDEGKWSAPERAPFDWEKI